MPGFSRVVASEMLILKVASLGCVQAQRSELELRARVLPLVFLLIPLPLNAKRNSSPVAHGHTIHCLGSSCSIVTKNCANLRRLTMDAWPQAGTGMQFVKSLPSGQCHGSSSSALDRQKPL